MLNQRNEASLNNAGTRGKVWPASVVAAFLMIGLGGCSMFSPSPETAAQKQVLATFDVSKCQTVDVNIYKCPAVDKPVCTADYTGTLECVRVGKNGSVYIANPGVD